MLLDLLLFPIFTAAVSLIGIGFWASAKRILCFQNNKLPEFLFPLFGAFAIGNISVVVNFFSGVAVSFSYSILIALLVYGWINASRDEKRSLLLLCFFAALCTPLAADMQPGPDAGLYHLPHQKWIREHEIVFGLANLHGRYGFSSFLEYINSVLWIGENFKLLSYMSALFFVSVLSFIYFAMNQSNAISRMFAALMALNILVYDRYFVWKYGYADSAAGIAFALSVALGIYILEAQKKNIDNLKALLFSFLIVSAMSVALKVSSILIVPWSIFVLISVQRNINFNLQKVARIIALPALFAAVWTIRGVIVSGCLLFPASWSCLDVSWSAKEEAINQAKWVTAWARHPHSGLSSLESWSWLTDFWLPNNTSFLLFLGLAAFAVFASAFATRHIYATERLPKIGALALVFLIITALALWFFKAPTDRFGIGVFMIAAPAIAIAVFGAAKLPTGPLVKVASLLLIFGLANNQGGFSLKGLSRFLFLTVPTVEMARDPAFGVRPKDGSGDCWTAEHCAPGKRPTPKLHSGYLFFETEPD